MSSPARSHALSTTYSRSGVANSMILQLQYLSCCCPCMANTTTQISEGSWGLRHSWILNYFSHPLPVKVLRTLETRTLNSFAFHDTHVGEWRLAKHNTKKHEDSECIFKGSKILLIMTRNDFSFFFNGWRCKHCFYKSLHLGRCQHSFCINYPCWNAKAWSQRKTQTVMPVLSQILVTILHVLIIATSVD